MKSNRLLSLPRYLFEELESRYAEAVSSGKDVINISIGDPDLDPPGSLIAHMKTALGKRRHHRYPPQRGDSGLKQAIRSFLSRNYGIEPEDDEILVLVGSKEGIAHLALAVTNPGDKVLVPDPGYPVYNSSAVFAGCKPVPLKLEERKGFLPDTGALAEDELEGVKLCFINYPNNPTSACASPELLRETLDYMNGNGIILANDAAYADIFFEERPTILSSLEGALSSYSIEFFSFSKMFSITGWRVGFAVGNRKIIDALAQLKANIDSGVFGGIQEAVAATLNSDGETYMEELRETYGKRRDRAIAVVRKLGFSFFYPKATFYLWVKVPQSWSSMDFAVKLLEEADVLVTPGVGFGKMGEGFFRIALTCNLDRLEEAGRRILRVMSNTPKQDRRE